MEYNPSLNRLNSIIEFLKSSSRFFFQNYNLKVFIDFIHSDKIFSAILKSLETKYPAIVDYGRQYATEGSIDIDGQPSRLPELRARNLINDFEEWVCFCYSYLQHLPTNVGNQVIHRFLTETPNNENFEKDKIRFFNDCVLPIQIFLTLSIQNVETAISVMQRYKVLCEWFNRESILEKDEVEITKNHLGKFLFDQGYTYSLSETNVPTGRIDNFAFSIGSTRAELQNLPNAIISEGKIFSQAKRVIRDVQNQVHRRINELNFSEGYCVIYNKSPKEIILTNTDGSIEGVNYKIINSKRIYFLIINLHQSFYDSIAEIRTTEIALQEGT